MKRILVVDNVEEITEMVRVILSKKNYEIRTTFSGKGCLEVVEVFQPDLIFLDVMMPDMDGFTVLDRLEEQGYLDKLKVILFTVKFMEDKDMERVKKEPNLFYLKKPILVDELLGKLEEVFGEDGNRV